MRRCHSLPWGYYTPTRDGRKLRLRGRGGNAGLSDAGAGRMMMVGTLMRVGIRGIVGNRMAVRLPAGFGYEFSFGRCGFGCGRCGGGNQGALPFRQVRQGGGGQHLPDGILHGLPDFLLGAGVGEHAVGGQGEAVQRRDVAVQQLHDVVEVDARRRLRQQVAALGPAAAEHQAAFVEGGHQAFQVGFGDALPLGDGGGRHRPGAVAHCQFYEGAHAVVHFHRNTQGDTSLRRRLYPPGAGMPTRAAGRLNLCRHSGASRNLRHLGGVGMADGKRGCGRNVKMVRPARVAVGPVTRRLMTAFSDLMRMGLCGAAAGVFVAGGARV